MKTIRVIITSVVWAYLSFVCSIHILSSVGFNMSSVAGFMVNKWIAVVLVAWLCTIILCNIIKEFEER